MKKWVDRDGHEELKLSEGASILVRDAHFGFYVNGLLVYHGLVLVNGSDPELVKRAAIAEVQAWCTRLMSNVPVVDREDSKWIKEHHCEVFFQGAFAVSLRFCSDQQEAFREYQFWALQRREDFPYGPYLASGGVTSDLPVDLCQPYALLEAGKFLAREGMKLQHGISVGTMLQISRTVSPPVPYQDSSLDDLMKKVVAKVEFEPELTVRVKPKTASGSLAWCQKHGRGYDSGLGCPDC